MEQPDEARFACQVVELPDSGEAVARVLAGDHELPRVGFPAESLIRHGLKVGAWYWWSPGTDGIDSDCPDPSPSRLGDAAIAELDRLCRDARADRSPWPEYTGDGK